MKKNDTVIPEKHIDTVNIAIACLFVLSLLTGIVNQNILSIGVIICCVFLFYSGDLPFAFPFIIFYNEFYGIVFGMSILRIFSFLLLLDVIIALAKSSMKIKLFYFAPLLVCGFYLSITAMQYSTQRAIFSFVDVLMCLFLIAYLNYEEEKVKKFFAIFVFVTLCSFASGIICGVQTTETTRDFLSYIRLSGTLEDPNYFGFFVNVAIFSTIVLKLFSTPIRRILVIILYVVMLASVSITAIIANIIIWIVYLLITRQINVKTVIIVFCVFIVMKGIYSYGLSHYDTPVIGPAAYRINDKLNGVYVQDYNSVTTGRVNLAKSNFAYYRSLPVIKKLFGGVSVNHMYIDQHLHGVSHNEYIDLLLNVGIVGELLMMLFLVWRTCSLYKEYTQSKSEIKLCFLMNKIIWVVYASSLTLFLDYRFLTFFLI